MPLRHDPAVPENPTTQDAPALSFVVLCYNFERFIGECLESVLAQEAEGSFEVIVLDDASTDRSVERIRAIRDPRIRLVARERNLGHSATINEALRLARAPLVARIDGDDRYRPGFLAAMLRVFAAHPEVGLAYADTARIDETGRVVAESQDAVHGGRDFLGSEFLPLLGRNFICAPTIVARREAWLSVPPVPEHLAFHDWYFTLLLSRDWPFFYRAEVLADYRIHASNMHSLNARTGIEEKSVLWLLDRVFAEDDARPDRRISRRQRARAYGAQYRDFADKYFRHRREADATRCYLEAIRRRPAELMDPGVVRRLLGMALGRERYDSLKAWLRGNRGLA